MKFSVPAFLVQIVLRVGVANGVVRITVVLVTDLGEESATP